MSPLVILIVLATAFLTGPTAFLFLWLTYVKTGERTVRTIAFSMLGLCFILLGNSASFILENYFRIYDGRIAFVLMNQVFIATIMMGGFLLRFAHEATGTAVTSARRSVFWIFTVLFFFLVISLPIFLVSDAEVNVRHGYLTSTLYGMLCQAYATVLIVAGRADLPKFYRRALPSGFVVLLGLGVISVMNDIIHFGPTLGGPDVPFSPFFFILINVGTVALCVKALLDADEKRKDGEPLPDCGFTGREREIVPLLIDGLSNEDIAERLFISPHTVKNHVTNIFRKADVANRFELLKKTSRPE